MGYGIVVIASLILLTACQQLRDQKYPHAASPKDLQVLMNAPAISPLAPPPKQSSSVLSPAPPQPTAAMQQPVSLALTEAMPLSEIFLELSRQAKVDLQLDPQIKGQLVFSAQNRPFIEIIDHLCQLTGLRYSILNQAVRIEVDAPYLVNYKVQFLNFSRTMQNRVSVATDVFSANANVAKGQADNGSNSTINMMGNNDFWQELENNLKIILNTEAKATYAIHKQGGLIMVCASQAQHRLLSEYLEKLRQMVTSQVLIEAKIVEVTLRDEFRSGINWQKLSGGSLFSKISLANASQQTRFTTPQSAQEEMLALGLRGSNFSIILKALETFGSARTLSSPRLTVMNNQTAILKVAQNQVYFRINYDKQFNLNVNRESISISSDIHTVPIGLVLSVQPSIDETNDEVILALRPTISRLSHSIRDPAVDIAFSASNNHPIDFKPSLVPVVEVREMDSVLRLKSGEIGVLGGLMEVRLTNEEAKLPIIGDLPLIGEAFTAISDAQEVVELVILLRVTIGGELGPDAADFRLYDEYTEDPRPL